MIDFHIAHAIQKQYFNKKTPSLMVMKHYHTKSLAGNHMDLNLENKCKMFLTVKCITRKQLHEVKLSALNLLILMPKIFYCNSYIG